MRGSVEVVPTKKPILGVQPGKPVRVPGWQGRILVAVGAAKYPDSPALQSEPAPEPVPEPVPPPKRRGRPPGSKNKPADKPKRRYKRRDLRPEE